MSNTVTTVKDFLEHSVAALRRNGIGHSGINGYFCVMDFVLQNGKEWQPGTVCWAKNALACYRHAAKAALRNRAYTYVEGYASHNVVPVPHAWLVDPDGLVIETTWRKMGGSYFGIPFRTDYLRQQINATRRYSLIDQWQDDWPTIRTPKEKWLGEIK